MALPRARVWGQGESRQTSDAPATVQSPRRAAFNAFVKLLSSHTDENIMYTKHRCEQCDLAFSAWLELL